MWAYVFLHLRWRWTSWKGGPPRKICLGVTKSQILSNWTELNWTEVIAAAAAKSLRSCPTLCDPRDGSPLGSNNPGILQARTLEWVAISFSNAWKWKVKVRSFSHVRLLATPWTAAYQAPPSMGFSRQEYRSGVPLPSPGLPWGRRNTHAHTHIERERLLEKEKCVDSWDASSSRT